MMMIFVMAINVYICELWKKNLEMYPKTTVIDVKKHSTNIYFIMIKIRWFFFSTQYK